MNGIVIYKAAISFTSLLFLHITVKRAAIYFANNFRKTKKKPGHVTRAASGMQVLFSYHTH